MVDSDESRRTPPAATPAAQQQDEKRDSALARRWSVTRTWVSDHAPDAIALLAVLLGLALVLAAVLPHHFERFSLSGQYLPARARAAADAVAVIGGWVLLRMARGLRKRRRTEWRMAVVICSVLAVTDLVRSERRPIEALVNIVLLVALVLCRRQFIVTAGPVGRWWVLRRGVGALVVAALFGTATLYLPHHVSPHVGFLSRLGESAASLAGLGGFIHVRGDRFSDIFHTGLFIVGVIVLVAVLIAWLRPAASPPEVDATDQQRLRALLCTQGRRDSLGYFALRDDKSVVWSPSGKAAITYRVLDGVALAGADPVGDPEAWPGAIAEFRKLVEQHGWTPAVMGCSELGATIYKREYGLSTIALGDEAIVRTGEFTLSGRSMRGVRQAVNRVERAGYTATVDRVGDLTPAEVQDLRRAAEAWRADPVERGFSMALSRIGEPGDEDCVVVRAWRDGEIAGLLHFVPWSTDGLSLDLMRRNRNADNGLNEYMIARLVERCRDLGVERVSLNFAVFREALERGERIGAGPVLRLWRKILLIASRWWQIESLYKFNDKFEPCWEPRFFSFPRVRDIPRIALAALEAEAFVVRPRMFAAAQRPAGSSTGQGR